MSDFYVKKHDDFASIRLSEREAVRECNRVLVGIRNGVVLGLVALGAIAVIVSLAL